MKGTTICNIPERRYHNLRKFLDEFMLTNAKHFKVEYTEGEYASPRAGYLSLRKAVKQGQYPIYVSRVKDEVYLTRTDM